MPQFVLILRDRDWNPEAMSPEELQSVLARYRAWNDRMQGRGGHKLRDGEGRVIVRNGKGVTVTDGPYAEAKEILGGFMIIEAADYDEAVRQCDDSPHLDIGSIEIRQIDRD